MNGPRLLDIPAACRELGIGRSKLYELIAADEVSILKIGTRTMLVSASLDAFIERHLSAA